MQSTMYLAKKDSSRTDPGIKEGGGVQVSAKITEHLCTCTQCDTPEMAIIVSPFVPNWPLICSDIWE